ncbi:amidohydrolase family protein [Paenibacillus cremeus]|uniref:Amidohydrolase n=1 Tax=Paenibacillus cremeus TaxID=2163881 RepID=A0A559K9P0_9BACL|nr:amidohydrolase family protein [Paenibacillus cremeus]TVY08836.1 amidohydrolase [Paenibacillus cremeus]
MARKQGIIDCDVHPYPTSIDEIKHYLEQPWKERYSGAGRGMYNNPVNNGRMDARTPSGGPSGSDPAYLRRHHLDVYGIQYAILMPRAFCNWLPDPDFATAIAAAYNQWLADKWLDNNNEDGVYKGSITIAHQDPLAAAKEIEKWAGHPHFVQVMTDSGSRVAFGQRQYYPIFEACQKYGLPFAIHPGTDSVGINDAPTVGYPTHFIEWFTLLSNSFASHLVSMLTEGVFERFPGLQVVLVEGGVSWLAPLMWRLDANYKALRYEVPWLKKLPSEYLRDHVRVTSQPLERPNNDAHLLNILDAMDAEHILMFASDYPHFDFDSPKYAFPKLPDALYQRIFYQNAKEFYHLE